MAGENVQTKIATPRVTERMIRARAQAGRRCNILAMDATTTATPLASAINPAIADGLAPSIISQRTPTPSPAVSPHAPKKMAGHVMYRSQAAITARVRLAVTARRISGRSNEPATIMSDSAEPNSTMAIIGQVCAWRSRPAATGSE